MNATLFKSKSATIQKKYAFTLSAQMIGRIDAVERKAEKAGVYFPLNEHVEKAIDRLLSQAETQLSSQAHTDVEPGL